MPINSKLHPSKNSVMGRCLFGTSAFAVALLVLSSQYQADAFAPQPALRQQIRSASNASPQLSARFAMEPHEVEVELVNNDDFDSRRKRILEPVEMENEKSIVEKKSTNPTPVLFKFFQDMSKKHAAFAAVAALAFTLVLTPFPSNAAMSGGRMGGSFSAPRSSMGSMSPSRSYGGGYSRGFSSGYGAGYYSRGPGLMVSPFVSPFASPFYAPGYYGGSGVITYSRGPSLLPLLIFGVMAYTVASSVMNAGSSIAASSPWGSSSSLLSGASSALGPGTSVVQVTVALEVPNRDAPNSILSTLERLANTARTDSRVGVQNLTSQVAVELLRRKSSIVSASTNFKHFNDRSQALRYFNNRSVQERGKFESETVSNYGGVDYGRGQGTQAVPSSKATMAVVTLLISIDGDSTKMPRINSVGDVEDALRRIASDSKVDDCLQGAEILWTPEDRAEVLSTRDVVADYPELRSV